jgi:hypothetical protein
MRATVLGVLTILAVAAQAGFVSGFQRAPNFAGGGPWFNTGGKALTIEGLRGKVVAVEMWTAG